MEMPRERQGFTLLEISIVLVIIGLVLGGVMVGKNLIQAAEIRNAITQIEKLSTAVNAFKLKYNCLPGDCTNAGQFGFTNEDGSAITQGAIGDGNGDGMLSFLTTENYNAFRWMYQAGMGPPPATTGLAACCGLVPAAIKGGQQGLAPHWALLWIYASDVESGNVYFSEANSPSGHYFWLSAIFPNNSSTAILPYEAYSIDSKIDNGLPRCGKVLASGNDVSDSNVQAPMEDPTGAISGPDKGPPGANSHFCVTTETPNKYNVLNISRRSGNGISYVSSLCTLTIKAAF